MQSKNNPPFFVFNLYGNYPVHKANRYLWSYFLEKNLNFNLIRK